MKFIETDSPIVVIDDFYDEKELSLIWLELDFLTDASKLQSPKETLGAIDEEKNQLKSNHGLFLEDIYQDRKFSNILTLNRKMFSPDIRKSLISVSPEFKYVDNINFDVTLLSYYENNDFYKGHRDKSVLSFVYWCNKEPKQFSGGDLHFEELNQTIGYKNNRLIIFPSHYIHVVSNVEMEEKYSDNKFSTFGRYSMSTFAIIQ
jgi:Rps23 Pro-64 3,4-dihydroxylase Tpa1-like proline 4-hydroxylase